MKVLIERGHLCSSKLKSKCLKCEAEMGLEGGRGVNTGRRPVNDAQEEDLKRKQKRVWRMILWFDTFVMCERTQSLPTM